MHTEDVTHGRNQNVRSDARYQENEKYKAGEKVIKQIEYGKSQTNN